MANQSRPQRQSANMWKPKPRECGLTISQFNIRNCGYNEELATEFMQYVASTFARGDSKNE